MPRRLLQIVPTPDQVLNLATEELARALLEDMQAREHDSTAGMAMRGGLGAAIVTPGTFSSLRQNPQELQQQLNKAGRAAYALLEQRELAEAHPDAINAMNGYLQLTPKGRTASEAVNYEAVRMRGLLTEEMLHKALRGKIYRDFADGELDVAVNEAFRTVEIEVRTAGGLPEKENGKAVIGRPLMHRAFSLGGPLSRPTDTRTECEALVGLFDGANSRFRNPSAHTRRTFADVLEAMEELMFASRLLRLIDERRRP